MNADALKNAIDRFDNARILVIGDLMLDQYMKGTVSRISPEAPVPVVEFASESFNPGGAGNTATNISALQGEVIVVGVIGNDVNGKKLLDLIQEKGVDIEGVITVDNRPTTVKTRIITEQQQVVRIDREVRDEISDKYVEQILDFVSKKLGYIDAILISDYDKGSITMGLLKGLVPLAKRQGKPIIADSKFRHLSGFQAVTSITPNLKEASAITGIRTTDEAGIHNMGRWLATRLKCETVLITCGKDGMALVASNGDMTIIPSVAKEVYDVTGAGDTVASVFTLGLATGASATDAAIISNIAAGIVVGKFGAATVTKDELNHELEVLKRDGLPRIKRIRADRKSA